MNQEILSRFLQDVPQRIRERGQDYYTDGRVRGLVKQSAGQYRAQVRGSDDAVYDVEINLDDAAEVSDVVCDCPYESGDVCKHAVAVLLAIGNGGTAATKNDAKAPTGKGRARSEIPSRPSLEQLLQRADADVLRHIMLEHARWDEAFHSDLILRLGRPDTKAQMEAIKEKVRQSIRRNTRRGYIDYSGCDAICDEMWACLDIAQEHATHGRLQTAFEMSLYLFLAGVKLASTADSSSGSLTGAMDRTAQLLQNVCRDAAKNAPEPDRKRCYDALCKSAMDKALEGWTDWRYTLLKEAARFVTHKNRHTLEAMLEQTGRRDRDGTLRRYERVEADLVRLGIVETLQGKQAARAFVDERVEEDVFREIAVREDMDNGNYADAERLCRGKATMRSNLYARPSIWWYLLYEIHQRTGDREKLTDTIVNLLKQGDLSFLTKLKERYEQNGEWEARCTTLLPELRQALSAYDYMHVLEKEDQRRLLLSEVKEHPEMVMVYGPKLVQVDAGAVYELYRGQIRQAAAQADNRKGYRGVCDMILKLHRVGAKDMAIELVGEYARSSMRRPALQDELEKLRKKLK